MDPPRSSQESFTNPPDYSFPHHRLNRVLRDSQKTPIALVACGSFSPVTYLHLRMFEMAKDYVRQNTDFEIVAGYLSPVSDMYKKAGLLSADHRSVLFIDPKATQTSFDPVRKTRTHVAMCTLAAEDTSSWLMVDAWEAFLPYQRTAVVLDHIDYEINTVLGGVQTKEGEHRNVRVMLLAGSDLISTMSEPGVWSYEDANHILGRYGCFIVERAGSNMEQATENLARWRHNICLINQLIQNDVSSTKVRLFLRRGLSVRYLLPANVVEYIEQNNLYQEDPASSSTSAGKGKERDSVTGGSRKELRV